MVALLTPFSVSGSFDDFNPVGAPPRRLEEGNANTLGLWAINQESGSDGRRYTNWTEASAPDGQLRYSHNSATEVPKQRNFVS